MNLRATIERVDQFQQRHAVTAFPFAVVKKFGDDQGGNLAAMLTYYGFLSLFPLLLVFFTVLGFVLDGHPGLQHDLRDSALSQFPIIGDQISRNVTSVRGSGIGLVIGILGTLWGGMGIANAGQDAMNRVWAVPMKARPGFLKRVARSAGLLCTLGLAIVVTTVLSGIGSGSGSLGAGIRIGAIALATVLNCLLFIVAFRVLTARDIAWRDLLPGAIFAAIAWGILQALGGLYVSRTVNGMSQTYGMFAIVLGLLAWIFLQARVVVYAAEINVVRAKRLWPRSLSAPPLTEGDRRAYTEYAQTEERRPEEEVHVDLRDAPRGSETDGEHVRDGDTAGAQEFSQDTAREGRPRSLTRERS
jgi:membrane protein